MATIDLQSRQTFLDSLHAAGWPLHILDTPDAAFLTPNLPAALAIAHHPDALTRTARTLARQASCGIAIVVLPGSRPQVALSLDHGVHLTHAPLDHPELRAPFATTRDPAELALALDRTLARQQLERTFFDDIRERVTSISRSWTSSVPLSASDRNALTLRMVARLMFLAFVATKRWLADDPCFLARIAHDHPRSLYRTTLQPLFFEALNQQRPTDPRFSDIPFLNGGLFERTPTESAHPDLDLPDTEAHALVNLLARYRFHPAERATDHAVDPRMLGTVFERLMLAPDRSRTGAHYTPPDLVDSLLNDAIEALHHDLSHARILDPAAGSGAFLLGALHRLLDHHRIHAPHRTDAEHIRHILAHQLYGIDLSDAAVTLCRLRLWLALAAHLPDGTGPHIEPLPNLSHRIRQGNALLSHTAWAAARSVELPAALLTRHRTHAAALALATHDAKLRHDTALRDTERNLAISLATAAVDRARHELHLHLDPPQTTLLPSQSVRDQTKTRQLQRTLDQAKTSLERTRTSDALAFDPHIHFADAMSDGGFDLVIGNPPWVRLSDQPADLRAALRATSRWVARAGSGLRFGAQPDLSVPFVERSLSLTRPGGATGLVLPSKLLSADYAGALRDGLISSAHLHSIRTLDLHGFDAAVYPMTLVATPDHREHPTRIHTHTTFDLPRPLLRAWNAPGAPFPLLSPDLARLLHHLLHIAPPLSDRLTPRMGIKTGCNAAFLDAPPSPHTYPALRGGDVRVDGFSPSTSLLFGHDPISGAPLTSLPSDLLNHLEGFLPTLRQRADARPDDPPWRIFRVRPEALHHRVAVRDIATTLTATALPPVSEGGPLALNTLFTIAVPDAPCAQRVARWLNASPCRFVARAIAEPAMHGYRRFRARTIACLPLPDPVLTGSGPLGHALSHTHTPEEVDALACRILGLTTNERQLITP